MNAGIDWGRGTTNIDQATGIRYGVIPANDLGESWYESSEPDYGPPSCPKCGNEAESCHDSERTDEMEVSGAGDFVCESCQYAFDGDEAFGDEPVGGFSLDDGEYKAHQGHDDSDVFILESPYYTRAQFCSPCAPGAAYLRNPCEDGPKAYCFDPSWFRPWNDNQVTGEYAGERTSCPYPVWRVADDELVFQPQT